VIHIYIYIYIYDISSLRVNVTRPACTYLQYNELYFQPNNVKQVEVTVTSCIKRERVTNLNFRYENYLLYKLGIHYIYIYIYIYTHIHVCVS